VIAGAVVCAAGGVVAVTGMLVALMAPAVRVLMMMHGRSFFRVR
jgi:hypothetical protein